MAHQSHGQEVSYVRRELSAVKSPYCETTYVCMYILMYVLMGGKKRWPHYKGGLFREVKNDRSGLFREVKNTE